MPDFAVNLSMLFTELPLIERFQAAAQAGFRKVEIQFPYELSIEQIRQQLDTNDLQLILINAPAGDWAAGERGIACHPERLEEFRQGLDLACQYASNLNCGMINVLSGIAPASCSSGEAEEAFIDNLKYAGALLEKSGIKLVAEAINTQDIPGFLLHNSQQAFDLFDRVGQSNLKLQYDIYHMQIMEGNLIHTLRNNLHRIGHIQFADVPGRHEPQTGELNFTNIFNALDDMGYSGPLSLEYVPATTTLPGLSWMANY
ncbi:hydroxypyruvate isomerase family protein [Amphritea sp. HPY]|uniref:hydroxypyruvate isomerase family protein n=1 Tax=Amphritea sp. HPY TaxID=3421652 RepID=UPI003D7D89C0